jgi:hypothetical protein
LALSAARSASVAFLAAAKRSAARVRAAVPHALAHRGRKLRQRALGIAEDRDLLGIILAQLPRIDVEMDDRHAGRDRLRLRRQRPGEEIAADREQEVVLLEHRKHRVRQPHHGAAEQRVRGRERRGARHRLRVDRRPDQLGEFDQLRVRAALRHRVARHDQRPLGLGDQRRRLSDRRSVAAGARRDAGRCHQVEIGLGIEDVARQRQEHRAGRRGERGLRRAVDDARQVGEAMHLGCPLHQRPRDRRQVRPQDRLGDVEGLLVLAGGDQDRRSSLLGVVEHAHRVAEPRRHVQVDDGELARCLGVAVGHCHHRRLLQGEHVAHLVVDRERVHQRQLGGAGIAEHDRDAFLLEQLEEGALSGHGGHEKTSEYDR